jgi:hypothetical protein
MKTIKFLFVTAIVAFLSVSCDKELEMLERFGHHGSTEVQTDTTATECPDTTATENPDITTPESPDTIIVINPDSTNTQNPDTSFNLDPAIVSGTGEYATQVVDISNFSEVELKKIGEVEIVSGGDYKVEISDYENLLSYAKLNLVGERLVISYDDSKQVMGSKLKIRITIPDKLSKAIISGAGNIDIQSGLSTESVQLIVTGSGNILAANINCSSVIIEMPGTGEIEAKGITRDLTLNARGSGTIKCKELESTNASCDISGVCTVFLSANENLKVNAMGIGSLTYYGSPILEINKGMLFSLVKG